jgi:hypothetical protein
MKSLVCSLMLCSYAVSSATGRDSAEMQRDRHIFCNQFVIKDPAPASSWDSTGDCCRFANRIRDCHVNDWGEK